jgi:hypothetical protein
MPFPIPKPKHFKNHVASRTCYCKRCTTRRRAEDARAAKAETETLWRKCNLCVADIPHLWHPFGEQGEP